ncbi:MULTISPECIES: hypothetical protein [Paraburkholderia]|uniref:hypothetical protein n=1 Tax=Paraburkholderia TaxID=1822464 RepID=UPI000347793C|nr:MULTISPECIES: hypothetical protein [Paraburkholderia]WEY42899.1 carboxypeptidase regulatory-like domain-containing protein [Paraburkholderia sp. SUR17]
MSNISARVLAALLLSCVFANTYALAQTAQAVPAVPAVPTPVERNGVTYITGGIGEDEVRAFREVAPKYNLRVTLASKAGHYLSDINVSIASGKRVVLAVHTEGPFLFARVPPGSYRITARDRHVTITKQVVVPRQGGIDVHFYWDDPDRHDVMLICQRCPTPAPK